MKLEITTYGMKIIPESAIDVVYLSNFLGLKKKGDFVRLVREDDFWAQDMAYYIVRPDSPHEQALKKQK